MSPKYNLKKDARFYSELTDVKFTDSRRRVTALHHVADQLAKATAEPIALLDHQKRAVAELAEGFESAARGTLIMPWQTGKSVVATELARELGASTVLVSVKHQIAIAGTVELWQRQHPDARILSMDFADQSSAKSLERVVEFLADSSGTRILVATHGTLRKVEEAVGEIPGFRFDFALFEDAHLIAGRKGKSSQVALDDRRLPAKARLFSTATPTVYKGNEANLAVSMSSAEFGEVLHCLDFRDAVESGLICPFQLLVVRVDSSDASEALAALRGPAASTIADERSMGIVVAQIAAIKAIKQYNLKRLITFHRLIDYSREFVRLMDTTWAALHESDRPWALESRHIDHETDDAGRQAIFDWFALDPHVPKILSNPRLLASSATCAAADGVLFVDTTRKGPDLLDAVSRALRPANGKIAGSLVAPISCRDGESVVEALARPENHAVASILSALRSMDPAGWNSVQTLAAPSSSSLSELPRGASSVIFSDLATSAAELAAAIHVDPVRASKDRTAGEQPLPHGPKEPESTTSKHVSQYDVDQRALIAAQVWRRTMGRPVRSTDFICDFPLGKWFHEALCRWERGELPEAVQRWVAREFSWAEVLPNDFPLARKGMFRLDPSSATHRLARRLDALNAGATQRTYPVGATHLTREHLREIVEAVEVDSDPNAYEAEVNRLVDTGRIVLRICRRTHPREAVSAYIAVLRAGSAPDGADLNVHRNSPESIAECRTIGMKLALAALDGKYIPRSAAEMRDRYLTPVEPEPPKAGTTRNSRRKSRKARRLVDGGNERTRRPRG